MDGECRIMLICALIGAVGLFRLSCHVWNSGAQNAEPPGITVRSEILTIYASNTLIDFARAHPDIDSNDKLVRLIREAKLNVWFAVLARNHQADGKFVDILFAYRPGERPESFETTRAIHCALAGKPFDLDKAAVPAPEIQLLEDEMMVKEPVEGLRELLMH
jgi:hypothetical protein